MTTYALIHGAGDVGWYWHLVENELRRRGHRTVAPDLPIENDDASLLHNAQVVVDAVEAIHDGGELVVVGHSYGGYIAPIVADRAMADRLILVAAMIPRPGETADEMWQATAWQMPRHEESSAIGVFYHDVDPALASEAMSRERRQSETTSREPWPLPAGRMCPRTSSSAATTGSSRPIGSAASCTTGSASSPMNSPAATLLRSAVQRSSWS